MKVNSSKEDTTIPNSRRKNATLIQSPATISSLRTSSTSRTDDAIVTEGTFNTVTGTSTDSSTVTVVDSCNSSFSGSEPNFPGDISCRSFPDAQFSSDLCVPYDDLAELEWLSNFVEESFSSEDLQKLHLISGMKVRTDGASETREFEPETDRNAPIFRPEMSVPGKARSKRSRAAPCNWTSRLLVLSQTTTTSTSSESDIASNSGKKTVKSNSQEERRCPTMRPPATVAKAASACIAQRIRRRSGGPGPWAQKRFAMLVALGISRAGSCPSTGLQRAQHLFSQSTRTLTAKCLSFGGKRRCKRPNNSSHSFCIRI
ncbi:hypothetical protein F0562_007105 [Nyssa sinensis]|uniref:GATA transcription factor n=1 Tax=Nyssa sinensis TaxID=561372 RepID=A0A5J5A474_9ASTE|nr:hypothetical protein F0562_007105 [Nyssa sinensis]